MKKEEIECLAVVLLPLFSLFLYNLFHVMFLFLNCNPLGSLIIGFVVASVLLANYTKIQVNFACISTNSTLKLIIIKASSDLEVCVN
jgi:hypothetical protein